jgi:hypothetical protein
MERAPWGPNFTCVNQPRMVESQIMFFNPILPGAVPRERVVQSEEGRF